MSNPYPPKHIVAVGGLVRNSTNAVLLIHSPRGDWEFPGGKVIFDFICRVTGGKAKLSAESLEVEWVLPDIAFARIARPAFRDRLKLMLTFTGNVVYRSYTVDFDVPYTVHEERYV